MKTTERLLCLALAATMTVTAPRGLYGADQAVASAIEALRREHAQLHQLTLDNGMVCLLKRDTSAPVVSIQMWVGTGSIHEDEYLGCGLSHAIEHMIFNGTEQRGPNDITHEINAAGGVINAYTTNDRVVFYTDLPARNWQVGFDAIADSLMHATFPAAEWQQEREVILREFAMGEDDPKRVISKLLWRTAFTRHPYRHPTIGYKDLFSQITRDDLATFFRRHYVPDNMILAIVGDIDIAAVRATVKATFADFTRRPRRPVVLPQEPPQTEPRVSRQEGAYQVSRLIYAYHTVPLSHPDAAALDVLAAIVGRGRSSLFVRKFKEEQQLVHTIEAWSYTPREPGLFGVAASFAPERETELCQALRKAIAGLARARFAQRDIATAVRQVLSDELEELTTMQGQASGYAAGLFFAGDTRFAESYLTRLQTVKADDLREVAARYLTEPNQTLVVLAPTSPVDTGAPEPAPTPGIAAPLRTTIQYDIPVITRENRRLPVVNLCVALRGGLLSETEDTVGITALMAELLVRGTAKRDAAAIARDVESLGGRLTAFSGYNSFGLQASCLTPDVDTFMALVAECLTESTFPADELDKTRQLQIASLRQQQERPMYLAQTNLRERLFAGHPYRWERLGSETTLAALNRAAIRDYYRRLVVSGNLVIAVCGDIDAPTATALAAHHLRGIPRGSVAIAKAAAAPSLPQRCVVEAPRQQAIVLAGFPGVTVFDPRADALNLLERAMSGLASDLAEAVRGQGALAYYVGAYQQLGLDPGAFILYAGTRRDAVGTVETLFERELGRVAGQGLRGEELTRARNQLVAAHDMRLQDNAQTAMTCALNELYGLGYDYAFSLPDRLAGITVDDVRRAAAGVLSTNRMATSIVLPLAQPTEGAPNDARQSAPTRDR
jgi:zinc protease